MGQANAGQHAHARRSKADANTCPVKSSHKFVLMRPIMFRLAVPPPPRPMHAETVTCSPALAGMEICYELSTEWRKVLNKCPLAGHAQAMSRAMKYTAHELAKGGPIDSKASAADLRKQHHAWRLEPPARHKALSWRIRLEDMARATPPPAKWCNQRLG